jgi:cell division protein FtsZ
MENNTTDNAGQAGLNAGQPAPMRFSLNRPNGASIKVIGVGGGGSNAVNYMFEQGINGVDFIVCNTDNQALVASPVPNRIQLGTTLTKGQGAGSNPEIGQNAAIENLDDVMKCVGEGTNMVFVTAGMGGGTGTGAAPIIARSCKEAGILTVGIITVPFGFEGRRRADQAGLGLEEMRDAVDTLLVIRNDKLRELFGNLTVGKAFSNADEVLCTAAKGIAEVITHTGDINVDMNDVKTVMRDSGVAIMGAGRAVGEGRALAAVTDAMESPLLNDNDITGARYVLLNITYGSEEALMDEITEITDHIQDCAGQEAEVIWGYGSDDSLENELCVTVIATGFESASDAGHDVEEEEDVRTMLVVDGGVEVSTLLDTPTNGLRTTVFTEEEACEAGGDIGAAERATFGMESDDVHLKMGGEDVTNPADEPGIAQTPHDLFASMPNDGMPNDGMILKASDESEDESALVDENGEELAGDYKIFDISDDVETNHFPEDLNGIKFTEEQELKGATGSVGAAAQAVEITASVTGEVVANPGAAAGAIPAVSPEDIQKLNEARMKRIMESTNVLRTPTGLSKLESEPAYKRRNVNLIHTPHSSESTASRLSVENDGENGPELRTNNPFLHDNVD